MLRAIAAVAGVAFVALVAACSAGGSPDAVAISPAAAPPATATAFAAATAPTPTGASPCPDPMAVIKTFYDANDASEFDGSLALLATDATLSSWAEGVNGRHWQEKHLTGKEQIRTVLDNRGLRRTSGQPDDPIFRETEAQTSGDRVTFMLRPDRLSPDGRPYNPYRVEAVFHGCKIVALTIIECISWE